MRLFLLFYLLFTPLIAFAQNNINGKVSDASMGKPLIGAHIFNNSTNEGVTTNQNGRFDQLIASEGDTLTTTHIGFEEKDIIYNNESQLKIQLHSIALDFSGVSIRGFEDNARLFNAPVSAAFISNDDLSKQDNASLQPVISSKPGIRMEERAAGSYRLSIRGSQLRAPFGVRNVKVYWNEIPFTEPGGNTYLNVIDFNLINNIEILRGPAGSTYGAGTGGVVMLESLPADDEKSSVSFNSRLGSYGQHSYGSNIRINNDNSSHLINFSRRISDGYREHNALKRNTALYSGQFDADDENSFEFIANYTDYFYEIPGALNADQAEEDRTQSRPNNPFSPYDDGSLRQNASINIENFFLGGSHKFNGENFENVLSTGGHFRSFDHPFNIDYKKSADLSFQLRNRSTYHFSKWERDFNISAGGEVQRGFRSYRNYGNVGGRPDTLRLDDEISSVNALTFVQAKAYFDHGIEMTAGMSLNHRQIQINRISDASANPDKYEFDLSFDPVFSPRLAILKNWDNKYAVFASISHGFSPPTFEEIRTSEGTINRSLESERGINSEIGFRFRNPENRITAETSLFAFKLNNTIVGYTPDEVELFRNQGATSQNGVETSLSWRVLERPGKVVSGLGFSMSYTYNHFFFDEYENDGEDISGNRLTGVPPHDFFGRMDVDLLDFWQMNVSANAVDRIPLNDVGSVNSEAYLKLDVKNNFDFQISEKYELTVYGGVNNLLNQEYSLGNDLNAYGERYFQPAPERNYFGGMNISRVF